MKKLLNLCFVLEDDRILLAMKKRGFGEGRWNGYGGKVTNGETIEQSAIREIHEESGMVVQNLEKRGILEFSFEAESQTLEVHVYLIAEYEGEATETEEMKPAWFAFDDIPYDQMWSDDTYWLPLFIAGKKFMGKFHFDRPADPDHPAKILSYDIEEVDAL